MEYPGLPKCLFGASGKACLCSLNICCGTTTESYIATRTWCITHFSASIPFPCPRGFPVSVCLLVASSVLKEPFICQDACQQISIRMSMIHVELLRHCRAFLLPGGDQYDSAVFHAGCCTIRDTPLVSRIPCRNIFSLA